MTDPIADMLSRIRNATSVGRKRVDVPSSRLKTEIARILQSEGYIHAFKMIEIPRETGQVSQSMIRIQLKYGSRGERVISGIQRVSRPGRRVYFRGASCKPMTYGILESSNSDYQSPTKTLPRDDNRKA